MLHIFRDKKGASMAIIGISMTSLMGFSALAVDTGLVYTTKSKTVTVADGAALAGVKALPDVSHNLNPPAGINTDGLNRASTAVSEIASRNGVTPNTNGWQTVGATPAFDSATGTYTMTTTVTRDTPLFFAKALNMNTMLVSSTATARATPISKITADSSKVMPWAISETDYYGKYIPFRDYGGHFKFRCGTLYTAPHHDLQIGNFLGLYFGTSATQTDASALYKSGVQNGVGKTISVGDSIPTMKVQPTLSQTNAALQTRLDEFGGNTYLTVSESAESVVYVPIVAKFPIDWKPGDPLTVKGFVAFSLENVVSSGSSYWVRGTFKEMTGTHTEFVPGNAGNYGLYKYELIK